MASFAGVSVVTEGKLCTTLPVDVGTNSGYHLLAVKGYSSSVEEMPNGDEIVSGTFMVGGHKWSIGYSPNGLMPSCADYISLNVRLDDDEDKGAVEVKINVSFVDQVDKQKPKKLFASKTNIFTVEAPCRYVEFMKRDVLERSAHLKADSFTIRCDMMVCNNLNTQDAADATLGEHLKILLQDKLGSDVTFRVSGETFTAHRCVLAARSKVFKAQLFGSMLEGNTPDVIQIKDMEAKVFGALLSFIYSDSFPEMEEEDEAQSVEGEKEALEVKEMSEAEEEEKAAELNTWLQHLFLAADRFDIQQLKVLCENKLSKHLDVSSVTSTLVLAEQHHCHGLKDACLKFIQVQSLPCLEKVMETDGWKHISTTYPSILVELIVRFASNHQEDKKRKRLSI